VGTASLTIRMSLKGSFVCLTRALCHMSLVTTLCLIDDW